MVQTDLSSDNFCGFNQSASPFYYTMDPVQNNVQFKVGEIGITPSVGVHTPGEVIKVDSYLKDIGNVLTRCNLPVPASDLKHINKTNCGNTNDNLNTNTNINNNKQVESENNVNSDNNLINETNIENSKRLSEEMERFGNYEYKNYNEFKEIKNKSTFLLPNFTREKGCAKDLSSVDFQGGFMGNKSNLLTNPQNLTHIIEKGIALQRGGLVSNQLIKETYKFDSPAVGNEQKTGCKIKIPYPTYAPFGLTYDCKYNTESVPFNANDVVSTGASSPDFDQVMGMPFNDSAKYINGGCNNVSKVKIDNICN